jgi:hypothetical protein
VDRALDQFYQVALVLTLWITGLGLGMSFGPGQILRTLRRGGLFARAAVLDVVIVPLLVWGLVHALSVPGHFATGLLLVGVASAGPLGIKAAQLAGADLSYAIALVVVLEATNAVAIPVAPAKLGTHPRGAVGAVRAGVDAADLTDQPGPLPLAVRGSLGDALGPGVGGRAGHPGRGAGGGYREACGLLGIGTPVATHGADVPVTQKATVRLSRSRSVRSRALSHSSSRSRVRSSLEGPSCSPRSMRSCLTQLPKVEP